MSDKELKELVASLAVGNKELREAQKETDRQLKETDRELKKMFAETGLQFKETDRKIKELFSETDLQFKETDRKLKSVGIQLGNISKNQGDVAEEYFINSLKEKLQVANLSFDALLSNVQLQTRKINDEFDILLVNGDAVAVIEVKYKVHPKDVDKLKQKIEHIKLMPSYKNYKIYAGIAGFKIPQDVIEDAKERGYFVLKRKGDVIEEYSDNLVAA